MDPTVAVTPAVTPAVTGRSESAHRIVAWVVPALLAAGLGLWRLTGAALWADELATWGAVRLGWAQLWQLSGSVDAVLTPYYSVMKLYTAVAGTSTAALRLPAVAAIVGTTLVVTALGRRVGGTRVGGLAGALFAVLPVTSRYAQEARPYALVMFGAALAVLCLIRLLEDPSPGRLAGYGAATGLVGLLHPLSASLMLAGHGVAVVWWKARHGRGDRRTVRWWATAAVAGATPAVLLAVLASRQTAQVSWIALLPPRALPTVPEGLFQSSAVGGLVLVLAVIGVRRGPAFSGLAAAAFVPLILLLLTGLRYPVWVPRYVLVVLPALAVLAASAVGRIGRRQGIVAVGLAAFLGYPAQVAVRADTGHSQASFRVAQVIGPRYLPGDVVIFPNTHVSIPWAPRDIYERYLPTPRPPDVLRTAPQRTNGALLARECPDAGCLGTPPRIWIIRVDNSADPLRDMAPGKRARIQKDYRYVQRWQYRLLGVVLVERRRG